MDKYKAAVEELISGLRRSINFKRSTGTEIEIKTGSNSSGHRLWMVRICLLCCEKLQSECCGVTISAE